MINRMAQQHVKPANAVMPLRIGQRPWRNQSSAMPVVESYVSMIAMERTIKKAPASID